MPIKSATYMLAYARQYGKTIKGKKRNTLLYYKKLVAELRFHKALIKISKFDKSIKSEMLCKSISGAMYAYVGFFYTLEEKQLDDYISEFNGKHSINLLALPAEMARKGEPMDKAMSTVSNYVASVPIINGKNVLNNLLGILQFEKNIAVKGVRSQTVDRLISISEMLDEKTGRIRKMSMEEIEDAKEKLIDGLAELAAEDQYMREVAMEMIGTESANTTKLFRIVRKKS
ncbi:MAG: hypothetical protein ACP5K5_02950 [Candidatus Micrarchaeia archaeon]